jgi:hypothetical protein
MNKITILSIIVMLFFANCLSAFSSNEYTVILKTNKSKAQIGEVVETYITVKGNDITNIDWKLCDSLIERKDQIKLISSRYLISKNGIFEKEIIFTVVKPGKLLFGSLPIIIYRYQKLDTAFTNNCQIFFLTTKLPTSINDIKSIYRRDVFLVRYFLISAFILIAILLTKMFFKRKTSLYRIKRKVFLQKIHLLEEELKNNPLANSRINDAVFNLLKQYLGQNIINKTVNGSEQSLSNHIDLLPLIDEDKELINNILNISKKLRFSYQYETSNLPVKYLEDVKMFVTNYPPSII